MVDGVAAGKFCEVVWCFSVFVSFRWNGRVGVVGLRLADLMEI